MTLLLNPRDLKQKRMDSSTHFNSETKSFPAIFPHLGTYGFIQVFLYDARSCFPHQNNFFGCIRSQRVETARNGGITRLFSEESKKTFQSNAWCKILKNGDHSDHCIFLLFHKSYWKFFRRMWNVRKQKFLYTFHNIFQNRIMTISITTLTESYFAST